MKLQFSYYNLADNSQKHLSESEEGWRHEDQLCISTKDVRRENGLQHLARLQNAQLRSAGQR
jgi:thermostable 8-oxoguanine DNA glycosylase